VGKGKPETFDFLGFTHIGSQTRKGRFTIRRRTIVKRRCAKLRAIKQELRCRMHASVPETGQWLRSVLQGDYHYFAVPYNLDSLIQLRLEVGRAWLRLLRRRSQKARRRLTWKKFMRIQDHWLPKPRVYHPCAFSPPSPEAGAVCGSSACTDLRGGCLVRGLPTVTLPA
jgi:RNA-directed DNA polymerase